MNRLGFGGLRHEFCSAFFPVTRARTRRRPVEQARGAGRPGRDMHNDGPNATHVIGRTSEGAEIMGTPLRFDRHGVVFETFRQETVLQASEVLQEFRIVLQQHPIYSGRAMVRKVVDTGVVLTCEATLEDGWVDAAGGNGQPAPASLREEFSRFLGHWEKAYRVGPEFKVIVADLQAFLIELQLWCDQLEVRWSGQPAAERQARERAAGEELIEACRPALESLFERFEQVAKVIPDELQPVHQHFIRRQLHPMLLASPFASRVVRKPLGYAGDYEMVNMILRDPHEGPSLFGRVLNRWFIRQPPAEAHRNRVTYLADTLTTETLRALRHGRRLRVFNVGCGPAGEIQQFLAAGDLSNHADFTLLDFNQETLEVGRRTLEAARTAHGRSTPLSFIKKSVVQLIKTGTRTAEGSAGSFDLVYCAGLFDYLQDNVCRQLLQYFHELVAPGGLLIATNVDPSNPIQHWLGYLLEWHLIYRDARHMLDLSPAREEARVLADVTGVNVFLEVRKPAP